MRRKYTAAAGCLSWCWLVLSQQHSLFLPSTPVLCSFSANSLLLCLTNPQHQGFHDAMGHTLVKLWNVFVETKPMKLIMVGLDGAGKTTVLFKLKLGEVYVHCAPTVGFNVEQLDYCNSSFTVWDMGGQDKTRGLWRHYYAGVHAIIYVVDSFDRARAPEARQELHGLLGDPMLEHAFLCVLANKQDLPGAMTITEMTEALALSSVKNRKWIIQASCAQTGEGLLEAFSWLAARSKEVDLS